MARDANTCVTWFLNVIKWKHMSRESPFDLPYVTCFTALKNSTVKPNCKRNARLSRRAFSLPIFQGYNSIRLNLARSDPSVTMNYCD